MNSAGIYIHIPFCIKKCDYCDFYSIPGYNEDLIERYCQALVLELKLKASQWRQQRFATIFLGGGTPSLLLPSQVDRILTTIFANYSFITEQPEISMEANPATLHLEQLRDLKAAGVNRFSVGAQSFLEKELKILGRIHGTKELWDMLKMMEQVGITNFNLDLIYGIPGQSVEDWEYSLRCVSSSGAKHVSTYLLQLESTTPMAVKIAKGLMALPDDDLQREMYEKSINILTDQYFAQYEISNFAQNGYECRHNKLYWEACDYLGAGCGAVSLQQRRRTSNQPPLEQYMKAIQMGMPPAIEVLEEMTPSEKLAEAMIMGLRLCRGISRMSFLQRFGVDIFTRYQNEIEQCVEQNLLVIDEDYIRLTEQGYFLSNEVFYRFID